MTKPKTPSLPTTAGHPAPTRRHLLQTAATLPWWALPTLAAAQAANAPVAPPPSAPSPAAKAELTAGELQADLALLATLYETLHPGLLRYQSEAAYRQRLQALQQTFSRELPLATAFREFSRFTAAVRCGHTYANFYNQRPAVQQALFSGRDKLPFTFVWLGSRMVVTGGALPRGTEVLAIDGTPVAEVLARLLPLVRTDGHNEAKQHALLSVRGRDAWESFDIFYAQAFGAGPAFVLDLRSPAGATRREEVAAIGLAQRRAMLPPREPPSDATPPWLLRFEPGGAAVLTMDSWALYNTRWDWRRWLNAALDEVVERRAPALVVDLRDNEGGLDCGDVILARCIRQPLHEEGTERLVRYRRVPEALRAPLDTWDKRFFDWGDRVQPVAGREGWYRLNDSDTVRVIEPLGPRFAGALRVLVNNANSSATFRFASLVRQHRLGTLVGSGTGGNQRGITGGGIFFVRLPQTGLEADLPLIGQFSRGDAPDAGLQPDLPVPQTLEDLVAGRDSVLAAALRA
jgi:hypothetical protein